MWNVKAKDNAQPDPSRIPNPGCWDGRLGHDPTYRTESKVLLSQAEQASKSNQYGKTLNTVRKATEQLQEAFLLSFPSREGEFRALWCHSAFGIPGWDWDRAIAVIKENGFNAIIPNMLWA